MITEHDIYLVVCKPFHRWMMTDLHKIWMDSASNSVDGDADLKGTKNMRNAFKMMMKLIMMMKLMILYVLQLTFWRGLAFGLETSGTMRAVSQSWTQVTPGTQWQISSKSAGEYVVSIIFGGFPHSLLKRNCFQPGWYLKLVRVMVAGQGFASR